MKREYYADGEMLIDVKQQQFNRLRDIRSINDGSGIFPQHIPSGFTLKPTCLCQPNLCESCRHWGISTTDILRDDHESCTSDIICMEHSQYEEKL